MKTLLFALLALVVALGPMAGPTLAQDKSVFIPLLVYRTGPYAPSGIPIANGFVDYFTMVNERDGGINGVKVAWAPSWDRSWAAPSSSWCPCC